MPKSLKYSRLADQKTLNNVVKALIKQGVNVMVAENGAEAKAQIFKLIPKNAEIMNMNSTTLNQLGVDKEIVESGKYDPIRKQFAAMDQSKQGMEMKRLGAAQAWVIGSVHALTLEGQFMIASKTGSQLPSYAFGADNVLWVIGSQKIVKDLKAGFDRIYTYCLPLENVRAKKAYGKGSAVNKILIINKEDIPNRLNVIIVKENLGF